MIARDKEWRYQTINSKGVVILGSDLGYKILIDLGSKEINRWGGVISDFWKILVIRWVIAKDNKW